MTGDNRRPIVDKWGRRVRVGDSLRIEHSQSGVQDVEITITDPYWPGDILRAEGAVVIATFDATFGFGVLRCHNAEVVAWRRVRLTKITLLTAFPADMPVNLETLSNTIAETLLQHQGALDVEIERDSAVANVREEAKCTDWLANDLWVWHERRQQERWQNPTSANKPPAQAAWEQGKAAKPLQLLSHARPEREQTVPAMDDDSDTWNRIEDLLDQVLDQREAGELARKAKVERLVKRMRLLARNSARRGGSKPSAASAPKPKRPAR